MQKRLKVQTLFILFAKKIITDCLIKNYVLFNISKIYELTYGADLMYYLYSVITALKNLNLLFLVIYVLIMDIFSKTCKLWIINFIFRNGE